MVTFESARMDESGRLVAKPNSARVEYIDAENPPPKAVKVRVRYSKAQKSHPGTFKAYPRCSA